MASKDHRRLARRLMLAVPAIWLMVIEKLLRNKDTNERRSILYAMEQQLDAQAEACAFLAKLCGTIGEEAHEWNEGTPTQKDRRWLRWIKAAQRTQAKVSRVLGYTLVHRRLYLKETVRDIEQQIKARKSK